MGGSGEIKETTKEDKKEDKEEKGPFSTAQLAEKARDLGDGVTFVSAEPIRSATAQGMRVTYRFTDVSKIFVNPKPAAALGTEGAGKSAPRSMHFRFERKGDRSILTAILPPDEKKKGVAAPETTLEDLISRPEQFDGKTVSVRGQFRGENLFGDLPSSSRARSSDWVIKEDLFAVWVTGKKPKGAGWSLDASLKRDTGKWLQVMGRVRVANRVVTLEAVDVTLSKPPGEAAKVEAKPEPTPPPPPRPKRPPMVAFSLPLDGEREVPRDSVFKIQFSHDMDEATLKEHVLFRYAGRVQPGDNALDAVKVSYDGGLRTLRIDPGDLLRPGRIVEVVLLPGIQDLDGAPLETRPGIRPGAAADVLRFQVLAPGLTGDAR